MQEAGILSETSV